MSPNGVLWTLMTIAWAWPSALLAMARDVLERDRVALLRHDAARLHEAVAEAQVAELGGAPQQQILHEPSEPDQQHRRRRRALEQVVDGRDAAVGVAGRRREPEQVGGELPIDIGNPVPVMAQAPSGFWLVRSYPAPATAGRRARAARSRPAGNGQPSSAARAGCACGR